MLRINLTEAPEGTGKAKLKLRNLQLLSELFYYFWFSKFHTLLAKVTVRPSPSSSDFVSRASSSSPVLHKTDPQSISVKPTKEILNPP